MKSENEVFSQIYLNFTFIPLENKLIKKTQKLENNTIKKKVFQSKTIKNSFYNFYKNYKSRVMCFLKLKYQQVQVNFIFTAPNFRTQCVLYSAVFFTNIFLGPFKNSTIKRLKRPLVCYKQNAVVQICKHENRKEIIEPSFFFENYNVKYISENFQATKNVSENMTLDFGFEEYKANQTKNYSNSKNQFWDLSVDLSTFNKPAFNPEAKENLAFFQPKQALVTSRSFPNLSSVRAKPLKPLKTPSQLNSVLQTRFGIGSNFSRVMSLAINNEDFAFRKNCPDLNFTSQHLLFDLLANVDAFEVQQKVADFSKSKI